MVILLLYIVRLIRIILVVFNFNDSRCKGYGNKIGIKNRQSKYEKITILNGPGKKKVVKL